MSYDNHALKQFRRGNVVTLVALLAAAVVALALLFAAPGVLGAGQDLGKFNQFVQTSNTPSMKMLREGRDLIDAEQWAKASEKFTQFVNSFPKDRDVDVALYWLAYSLRKQGDARGAAELLQKLLKTYPRSAWADESRAMLNEIAGDLGESGILNKTLQNEGEEEEIKIIALRSLHETNPERALTYISEMLRPGSTASPRLKEAAVSLLGEYEGPAARATLLDIARTNPDSNLRARAIHRLGESGEQALDQLSQLYDAERTQDVKRQILHAISEMDESPRARAKLLAIARNAGEQQEMRRTAIHLLGERRGGSAFDDLSQIYASEQNLEIKRQVLHAFAEMEDPRGRTRLLEVARDRNENQELRRFAIHWLGEQGGEPSLDQLMSIYRTDPDVEIKRQILHAFSDMKTPRAHTLLVEAAKTGDNLDLRRAAIHHLGEAENPQALDLLISIYDAEANEEIKRHLLHAFADSKQKRGLQKLMDVARREKSLELRKAAIHWIGESDDPEALKFLEALLKP
jgi:HEAT repeat protein